MDIPELEQHEILKNMPKTEANINPTELNKEYKNILAASQRISESIDAISKISDDGTVSKEVKEFCMQNGIPIEFVRERLLFKKSVMNKIEKNMFTNPLKDAIQRNGDFYVEIEQNGFFPPKLTQKRNFSFILSFLGQPAVPAPTPSTSKT